MELLRLDTRRRSPRFQRLALHMMRKSTPVRMRKGSHEIHSTRPRNPAPRSAAVWPNSVSPMVHTERTRNSPPRALKQGVGLSAFGQRADNQGRCKMIPRPRKNRLALRAIEHSHAHENGDQGQIPSDYETPEEFGAHYGRSAKTIRMWAQRGWIHRLKLGKNILIPKSEHREVVKRFMIRACGRGE